MRLTTKATIASPPALLAAAAGLALSACTAEQFAADASTAAPAVVNGGSEDGFALPFTTAGGGTSAILRAAFRGAQTRLDDFGLADLGRAAGPATLPIAGVTASSEDDGNLASYAMDGDLGSHWSALGDGEWIQFDLGGVRSVGSVRLAWHKGDTRTQSFEIFAGTGPLAMAMVHRGASSGTTVNLETTALTPVRARFVRVVGHGNSASAWNSLAEVEFATPDTAAQADAGAPEPADAGAQEPADAGAQEPADAGGPGTSSGGPALDPGAVPGGNFDLSHWKLTIPGPTEIKPPELSGYTSEFFHTDPDDGSMTFWLDSSLEGTTSNSSYVRSELRELLDPNDRTKNWPTTGTHVMSAELQLRHTSQTPRSVTVLQIHGVQPDGSSAPPLVKVVMQEGSLYALVKRDPSGNNEDKTLVGANLGSSRFAAEVRVQDSHLIISVNGTVMLDKDVSFWTHVNYFKAGCYPQATSGISDVHFYKLGVTHL